MQLKHLRIMHLKQRFFPARCLCHVEPLRVSRAETPGGQTNWRLCYPQSIQGFHQNISINIWSVWPVIVNINTSYSWLIG